MTATRRTLLDRLLKLQNNGLNDHRDVMTITGFMSDAEVEQHIASLEREELEHVYALKPRRGRR